VAAHTPPVQLPLWQSPAAEHASPIAQPVQDPPQSVAVSLPFLNVSLHVGTWQRLPAQTALAQSAGKLQTPFTAHFFEHDPPQSTSVSSPFFCRSTHVAG